MGSGAIVTRRLYLSVGLAVGGAIVLMAGCATVLVGETHRLESASGFQSLTSLGIVLIGCGFALGVAFTAVTTAGLRGAGRTRAGQGSAPAEPGSLPGDGGYRPEAGPRTGMTLPGGWTRDSVAEVAEMAEVGGGGGTFGRDDRDAADYWGDDWGGPGEVSPVTVSGGDDPGDGTRAEGWLSHLRGSGLGPVHETARATPSESAAAPRIPAPAADYESLATPAAASYWPPAAPTSPAPTGYGPPVTADYGPPAQADYGPPVPPEYGPPAPPDRPGYGSPAGSPPAAAAAGYERPVAPRPAGYGSSAKPNPAGYGPPDYADEGWRLDGAESHGPRAAAQPPGAPEIHHPAAGRRHDTGQQPAYDTGQWRAFELDQPPPTGRET